LHNKQKVLKLNIGRSVELCFFTTKFPNSSLRSCIVSARLFKPTKKKFSKLKAPKIVIRPTQYKKLNFFKINLIHRALLRNKSNKTNKLKAIKVRNSKIILKKINKQIQYKLK
jgi:hypothetical protein